MQFPPRDIRAAVTERFEEEADRRDGEEDGEGGGDERTEKEVKRERIGRCTPKER